MNVREPHKKIQALTIFSLFGLIFASFITATLNQPSTSGHIANYAPATNTAHGAGIPWQIETIKASDAWTHTNCGKNTVVAILDTGIDANHEDLTGKVIGNVNFSRSNTYGDLNGHGTAVASLIAGSFIGKENAGGVAYSASLLNVKIAEDDGFVKSEAVVSGINWAVKNGANVINLSLTLKEQNKSIEDAINKAWNAGVIVVVAAGNAASPVPVYPAAYRNVISVGATAKNDSVCNWSSHGTWVKVYAPGIDLRTAAPGGKYAIQFGTSFSAPQVSGEAALLFAMSKDAGKNVSAGNVKNAIINNTDSGRINIVKALESLN